LSGLAFGEVGVADAEVAVKLDLFQKWIVAGRDDDVGAKAADAFEGRFVSADEEAEDIFDAAIADLQIDVGNFAVTLRSTFNFCGGDDGGVKKFCIDAGEGYVAICAVDQALVFGAERDDVFAASDAEIGNVDVAGGFDVSEDAGKFSGGGEHAGDAVEGGEVGVIESVSAFDGCLAHVGEIPGAEFASGVNFTGREGIGHGDVIGNGAVGTDGIESEGVDVEVNGGIICAMNLEDGIIGGDGADANFGIGLKGFGFATGRDLDVEAFEVDAGDVAGAEEEVGVAGVDGDAANGEEWGGGVFACERNAFGDATRAGEKRVVKFGELRVAREHFEGGGHVGLGEGPMGSEDDGGDDEEGEENEGRASEPGVPKWEAG